MSALILGTRGSDLALTQSRWVQRALAARGVDVTLRVMRTEGDVTRASLSRLGGVGVFAARLRVALLDGEAHLAVHSFKDLPTAPVPGLTIAAVPPRASVSDVLCATDGHTLQTLPEGARIGTGSIRRAAQLLMHRPDLRICDIRGNVPTRLGRVRGLGEGPGDLDGVILADAGLTRLGLREVATEIFPPTTLLPAPAQGALAVEASEAALAAHPDLAAALADLNDPLARAGALAERAVLAHLEAGCAAPVGAWAREESGALALTAGVIAIGGERAVTCDETAALPLDDAGALALGCRAGAALLDAGAADIADLSADRDAVRPDYFQAAPGRDLFGEDAR